MKINDSTATEVLKDKFIISNLSTFDLKMRWKDKVDPNTIVVLYGGVGNRLEIQINQAKREVRIEPLGVIVIGIDGLRQDVLYPANKDNVKEPYAPYNIDVLDLPGMGQILEGYSLPEKYQSYIMLPEVTAIFPSITMASWASIFTGKQPNETGITGNEFFARDLSNKSISVPERYKKPPGIISFGGGAFEGFDAFKFYELPFWKDFLIPYQLNWSQSADPKGTPQNDPLILTAKTIYERIKEISGIETYFKERGGDLSVVAHSHYARGASHWLTWDIPTPIIVTELTDSASWDKFDDYLSGRYKSGPFGILGRNKVPFSALTVWYLPGLDHDAHEHGMSTYRDYFKTSTDKYIWEFVGRLKELDEFDNKIFIIVSDHGMTAMPTGMKYTHVYEVVPDGGIYSEEEKDAEMSCKLKLDFHVDPENPEEGKNKQRAELANNNLHIWELAEVLKTVGSIQNTAIKNKYKVLAPIEIAKIFLDEKGAELPAGATNKIENAHIIGALNGPMAHIYVQGVSTGSVGEILRLMLQVEDTAGALKWLGLEDLDYKQIRKTTIERVQYSIDQILVRVGEGENSYYCVFDGPNEDGSPRCNSIARLDSTIYINSWERINGMNHPKRSGDIVLLMKDSTNDISQRFSTGSACKSWHGSLNPSDSYVPFIVAYPGGNKSEIGNILKKDTLCKADYGNCKGNWKLTDVVNEIISTQYK